MKPYSCPTNFILFYEEVSEKLDGGSPVNVVDLDFAKAFHTVHHKIVI